MIEAPHMLMIGSSGRTSGKTELACAILRKLGGQHDVVALKVTTIREPGGVCPRDGQGCGVCSSLDGHYAITQETDARGTKDTQRLLAGGASRVYWLRALKEHLEEGATALFDMLGPHTLILCESNSLRTVVEPGAFLLVHNSAGGRSKDSAQAVRKHADRLIISDGSAFDIDLSDLDIIGSAWALRLRAAAVIMAGGKSDRMEQDKALLPIGPKPLIEYVVAQVRPHFDRVLISANDPDKLAFLGLPIVSDKTPGLGPLMGIASALETSAHDLNFFLACDIPHVNMVVARRLLRESHGWDAVVPVTAGGHTEPLFAVYHKNMLGPIRAALDSGKRRIADAFESARINYVELGPAPWLKNLNTRQDYAAFVAGEREWE